MRRREPSRSPVKGEEYSPVGHSKHDIHKSQLSAKYENIEIAT